MDVEQNRLKTFENWPSDAPISAPRIAKAGFFYTQKDLIVECFSCHLQLSQWEYGDQVMTKHRILNPQCCFVQNPATSGNVPLGLPSPESSSSSQIPDLMKEEIFRLETFRTWPIPNIVSPERVARAGFYYMKSGDHTKCAFCEGVVRAWEIGDDPDKEHKKHFPRCSFVINTITPRLLEPPDATSSTTISNDKSHPHVSVGVSDNSQLVENGNKDLQGLGVQTYTGPRRPTFATMGSRLATFETWPADLIQTADNLAAAGFYYEGIEDKVRCFHCDGGLRHWDPEDDPWTEHAKWFPACSFVKLVKGQDFVESCSLELNTASPIAGRSSSSRDNPQLQQKDKESTPVQDDMLGKKISNINLEKPSTSSISTDISSALAEENRLLKEARLCKICLDTEVAIVFLPCGHLTTCVNCAANFEICPVCRSAIKATVRTFLS